MKKMIVLLIFFLVTSYSLKAVKLFSFTDVYKPSMFTVWEDKIYISDQYSVKIYSLYNFKFLKRLGSKGKGPEEFSDNPLVYFSKNKILLIDRSSDKLLIYSSKFKLIEEKRIPFRGSVDLQPVGRNYLNTHMGISEDRKATLNICVLNEEFKIIKTLLKKDFFNLIIPKKKKKEPKIQAINPINDFKCWSDKIFFVNGRKGFCVEIFDRNGNKKNIIKKAYNKVKTEEIHKKLRIEEIRYIPIFIKKPSKLKNLIFPEYLPEIQDFVISNDKIYIKTYLIKEGMTEYIILDFNGKELKRVFLPYTRKRFYTIKDNKFYYLNENIDNETFELHMEEIK